MGAQQAVGEEKGLGQGRKGHGASHGEAMEGAAGWVRDLRKCSETGGEEGRPRGSVLDPPTQGFCSGRPGEKGSKGSVRGPREGLEWETEGGTMEEPPLTFPGAQGRGPQHGSGAGSGSSPQQPGRGGTERQQQREGSGGRDRSRSPPRGHASAHHPSSGRRRKAWAVPVATRGCYHGDVRAVFLFLPPFKFKFSLFLILLFPLFQKGKTFPGEGAAADRSPPALPVRPCRPCCAGKAWQGYRGSG